MAKPREELEIWRRLGERNPYGAAILGSTGPTEPDQALMEIVKPESLVLDVGCGYGRNSLALQRLKHCDVVGIDFSSTMCKPAHRAGVPVVIGDVRYLPFRDASFDFAVSTLVFQHLPSTTLPDALHEFSRVARRSLFDLPNAWDLNASLRRVFAPGAMRKRQVKDIREHHGWLISHYSYDEIRTICRSIFDSVEIRAKSWGGLRLPKTRIWIPNLIRLTRFAKSFLCDCIKTRESGIESG